MSLIITTLTAFFCLLTCISAVPLPGGNFPSRGGPSNTFQGGINTRRASVRHLPPSHRPADIEDDVVSATDFLEETFLKLFRCPIVKADAKAAADSGTSGGGDQGGPSERPVADDGTSAKANGNGSGGSKVQDALGKCAEPKEVDIVWVIDASGSIGQADYSKGIEIAQTMAKFVEAENGVGPKSTRMAGISFSSNVRLNFNHLKDATSSNIKKVLQAFSEFPYDSASTATRPALQKALDLLNDFGRKDAQKIIFIFTDGASNAGGNPCTLAADIKVEYPEINVFSWGIGNNINEAELKCISGQYSRGDGRPPVAQVIRNRSYQGALDVANYAKANIYNNFQAA